MNKMNLIGKKLALLMLLSTSYVSAMAPNANNDLDSLLTKLPRVVTCEILSEWLPAEEAVRLDSAVTNHKGRVSFKETQGLPAAHYTLIMDNKNVTDDGVKSYVSKFKNIQNVSLKECRQLTSAALLDIATHCPHLKHINLAECNKFANAHIIGLTRLCPELETINLSDNRLDGNWDSIENPGFVEIANNCPNLITADFCRTYIHDEGINAFLKKCLKLKTLKVGGRVSITNAAFNGLEINEMLRHLLIIGRADITEEGFIVIAVSFPNLITAKFLGCRGLTDKVVEMLAKNCGNLLNVNFYACTLTDLSAESLTMYLPKLEKINLRRTYITDKAVDYLASRCNESLIKVDISENYAITDEAIKSLVTRCKNITRLNVNNCRKLTKVSFEAIAKNLHKLIRLNICKAEHTLRQDFITSEGMEELTQNCQDLTELQISDSNEIADEAIDILVKSCPKLTRIHISLLNRLSYASLEVLKENCPQLTLLDVRDASPCPELDNTLKEIKRIFGDKLTLDYE